MWFFIIFLITSVHSAYCDGKPDPNAKINMNPIIEANPRFIKAVPNGAMYMIGKGEDTLPVTHLWGNAYQKGFARGQLYKNEIPKFMDQVWKYLENEILDVVNVSFIPVDIKRWMSNIGLDVALDLTWLATLKYSKGHFTDEMTGIADATGYPVERIRRIHMIGELTKGACSMIGAWGKALGKDGLLTVRALDWSVDGSFRDYPEIVIYHAENESENTFLNLGWMGWVGSISGVNDKGMSIHEIGVSHPDDSFSYESRFGTPFTFLLRDVLQFDKNQLEGVERIRNADRTCNLILGIGSGSERIFNSMAVSASTFILNTDKTMLPKADWHPRMDGIVYHAMDWDCPYFSQTMSNRLKVHYGNLTYENIIRDILPLTSTGNLHTYVADLTHQQLWIANAQRSNASGEFYAFDRPYIHLDLPSFWKIER
jgi:isopenicillin-N N-acyltransferase-like protein